MQQKVLCFCKQRSNISLNSFVESQFISKYIGYISLVGKICLIYIVVTCINLIMIIPLQYYAHRAKLRLVNREIDLETLNRRALKMAREVADKTGYNKGFQYTFVDLCVFICEHEYQLW